MTPVHYAIASYPSNILYDGSDNNGTHAIIMLIDRGAKTDLNSIDGKSIYDIVTSYTGRNYISLLYEEIIPHFTEQNFSSLEKYQEFLQVQNPPSTTSFLIQAPIDSEQYRE